MSNGKWSAGPWEVKYCPKTGRPSGIFAPNDAGIPGAVGSVVRMRGIGFPMSEMARANARLIAAAPDLYEALTEALRWIGRLNDWEGAGDPDIDKWRAALNKAKGEQS